jgi:glycosidase
MGRRSPRRAFHVRRTARERHGIGPDLFATDGDLLISDVAAIRRLAARMNAGRPPGAASISAGEIGALGLLHEVCHLLIERYESTRRQDAMAAAMGEVEARLGRRGTRGLLDRFGAAFPGAGADPEPPLARLEELLLTRIANENPALGPLRELVDDRILAEGSAYETAIAALERSFADGPPMGSPGSSLVELMRAPARQVPTSLAGQLRYVRDHWGALLGDALAALIGQLDMALGILAEEERALHLRFGGVTGDAGTGGGEAPSFAGLAHEPEAFSADSAWMPRLVLIAKSTYVWLDQLSRRHGRDIRTLDAIPDEELDALARWGVTGLWLIGLWQRSRASERIKRMRGNADAVASAYSLDDYRIAEDLGGEAAHADLRDRAWARGIRLASDMVPNHMGIDSRWVIEHPEWFLSLPEPPYPAYAFSGADLSSDERVGIVLEDHYWDDSDAAVVFKRFDRRTGDERYVYHGNDGTSFPWNDTAQLDFLKPEVREQVIRTIVDVARHFPVIRFDAAMVLAKRHIQRLWWPLPGAGDGIPSRAQYAMSQAEFDARMPIEFWREVVDRVAAEVPDTLLLAEAFWMLEGYFVRTLGMHRVYNSAFMHMLRDEDGPGYRRLIKETLEFDPEILQRYVNFMSNPDEATAVAQFGRGDKYFGVATVMATLPGLPMLGHGQVEGFAEKYGMEYRRAVLDERPDAWLVERHEREIFPLLHRRGWFAGAHDFLLYDLVTDDGRVDEHVLAYSNGAGATRSLVVYHDRFASTGGTIRESAAYARRTASGARRLVRRSLAEGLALPDDAATFVAFRDARTGLEYLRSCREIRDRGLRLSLDAYACHVFWEFREIHDGSAGMWRHLAERLDGRGVPSLDGALRELELEPVHVPLRAVLEIVLAGAFLDGTETPADLDVFEVRQVDFLEAVAAATWASGDARAAAAGARDRARRALATAGADLDPVARAALLGWVVLSGIGSLARGADPVATSAAWFDELRLSPVLAAALRGATMDEGHAWAAADVVRVLLELPRPSAIRARGRSRDRRLLERWLALDRIRSAMGVNTWEGVEWIDRDRLDALLGWAVRLDAVDADAEPDRTLRDRVMEAAAAAGYRVDRLVARPAAGPKRAPRGSTRRSRARS